MIHYTVTLTAAARSVAEALGLGAAQDIPLRAVSFQPGKANTNDAFVGGPGVTTTNYGMRLDPADTAPPIPWGGFDSGPLKPSTMYLVGTAGEIVHILAVPF